MPTNDGKGGGADARPPIERGEGKERVYRNRLGERIFASRQADGSLKLRDAQGATTLEKEFAQALLQGIREAKETGLSASLDRRRNDETEDYIQAKIRPGTNSVDIRQGMGRVARLGQSARTVFAMRTVERMLSAAFE